eukprot:TRINITY_DN10207_c0_g3_i1.p1 TRINITY_DN10207_c0_g3~~TRINITY_DN10207_c0_g3_i1.p1  ORF type:complete len:307 (+),score=48.78 TRINITY_DN10207_c0_g3_i1:183-1103(+)
MTHSLGRVIARQSICCQCYGIFAEANDVKHLYICSCTLQRLPEARYESIEVSIAHSKQLTLKTPQPTMAERKGHTHHSHHTHKTHKTTKTTASRATETEASRIGFVGDRVATTSSFLPRCMLLAWTLTMILAFILLTVSYTQPDWVEGSVNGTEIEVGLFEQCLDGDCETIDVGDGSIGEWTGASVLYIIGMIFLGVAIILTLLVLCFLEVVLVLWAKAVLSLANLLFIIAALLFPIGFNKLDNSCDDADSTQCGLSCADDGNDFDFFILCAPFELGAGAILMVVGLMILFLSACCAACVRVDLES